MLAPAFPAIDSSQLSSLTRLLIANIIGAADDPCRGRPRLGRQRNSGPSPLAVLAIVVGLLMLMRFGFGPWVLAAALLGLLPH